MGVDIVVSGRVHLSVRDRAAMGALLQRQDYEKILNLVRSADLADELTDIREAITLTLMEMFRADSGIFILGDPDSGRLIPTNSVPVNLDTDYNDQYVQYYWRLDPTYDAVSSGHMTTFRLSDVAPSSPSVKTEYYKDFLRPQDIGAELVVCLLVDNRLSGSVSLFRSKRGVDFAYQEVQKARLASSYVSTIFRNAKLISQLREEKAVFQRSYESLGEGIIVLDDRLEARYWNSKAVDACHRLSPEGVNRRDCFDNQCLVIPEKVLEDCLILKTGFVNGRGDGAFVRRRKIYTGDETGGFRIASSIFTYPFQALSRPHFLISITNLPEIPPPSEGWTKGEYKLTKRELEVISHVSQGLTNQQIADKLFVSLFTVTTHLRNIYEKVGVRNRTELVFRLQSFL
jgi:DNA-binding CsgD family transcriptional regulator/GAF domain-containing protein